MSDESMEIEDDRILAAEYALRLLEGDEERAARVRVLTDRGFASEVAYWQEQFASMADDVAEVAPSGAARKALMNRLFPDAATNSPFSLAFWKGLAGAATAAAALFAFLAFVPADLTGPPPLFVSEISSDDQSLRVLAVIDAAAHTVRITRTSGDAATGRSLELWGIPADGQPPVSFGVLPGTETAEFIVPDALLGKAVGLTLAISDEPEGGSPTGQPTGAVLALGPVTAL